MDFEALQQYVQEKEHHALEFKRSTAQLKPAMQTLCAFLNGSSGKVILGVTDNGKIIGQHVADKTRAELGQILQQFEPHANVQVKYINLPDSTLQVIVLEAKPIAAHQPYVFCGRPYERKETTTHRMPQTRYEELLLARRSQLGGWESLPAYHLKIEDLDKEEILRTVQLGITKNRIPPSGFTLEPREALFQLGLMQDDHITNAAVILFANNPSLSYPQCLIRLARFNSSEKQNVVDSKQIQGHAFALLEAAIAFAHLHLPISSHFEGIERIDTLFFPEKVLREALINALCHRDYAVEGGSISFFIYSDHIEITSFGRLPQPLNPEKLKIRHDSIPCNPRIARVFYRRGMYDEYGAGTREIMELTLQAGHPEPEFLERDNTFVVRLLSKQPIGMATEPATKRGLLSSLQQEIVLLLQKEDRMSAEQLLSQLRSPSSPRTLRRALLELKKEGVIDSEGRARKTSWVLSKK
jgi:ATP-dependent DNA helicase RecG